MSYHVVHLGALDRLNGPATYPFPTSTAALRFAQAAKRLASVHAYANLDGSVTRGVDRSVLVAYPDGTAVEIELPDALGDLTDLEEV
ncbi:hypothetical protein A5630_25415 [Mycolicibacterium mucogenicum]|uniref:Uncharacterized protein n=1 Tax=Mycolicibacterium mucogenicum TaxID=56689 RepID=A0A1A3GY42_MYCMU|nr:hypothetical protein [Mycolicibacterium mucogenicum]OBJ40293.1 hypothetical protein A5630_25415 [Mycolicibacterium mucogenicum]